MGKIVIPKRYLKRAKQKGTLAIQGPDGRMRGRVALKSGKGDTTRSQYLARDFDINRDGKISANEEAGTIHGRSESVRGDSRKRGTIRRF